VPRIEHWLPHSASAVALHAAAISLVKFSTVPPSPVAVAPDVPVFLLKSWLS
jgi:hypothetical protein